MAVLAPNSIQLVIHGYPHDGSSRDWNCFFNYYCASPSPVTSDLLARNLAIHFRDISGVYAAFLNAIGGQVKVDTVACTSRDNDNNIWFGITDPFSDFGAALLPLPMTSPSQCAIITRVTASPGRAKYGRLHVPYTYSLDNDGTLTDDVLSYCNDLALAMLDTFPFVSTFSPCLISRTTFTAHPLTSTYPNLTSFNLRTRTRIRT